MPGTHGLTPGPADAITDVAGIGLGHDTLLDPNAGWATGVTVVACPEGAVGGVDVRGGGPGSRETDLLAPHNTVRHVHAVVLAGGSAYGLVAADGAMLELEAAGWGLPMDAHGHVVPIVPAAVIFDLPVGAWERRPDIVAGRRATRAALAALAAVDVDTPEQGCVGAGVGARVGALKGGIGTASARCTAGPAEGYTVGVVLVLNAVGHAVDPATGLPWGLGAGLGDEFADLPAPDAAARARLAELESKHTVLNTTIGVVSTDAPLDKAACRRLAMAAQAGLTRAVRPAHTPLDGDTFFALSTGRGEGPADRSGAFPGDLALQVALGEVAAGCVERAVVHALASATDLTVGNMHVPSWRTVVTATE